MDDRSPVIAEGSVHVNPQGTRDYPGSFSKDKGAQKTWGAYISGLPEMSCS